MKLVTLLLLVLFSFPSVSYAQSIVKSYKDGDLFVYVWDDGTATVGLSADKYSLDVWTAFCRVDAMTDEQSCSIFSGDGGIFLFYGAEKTPISVCVVGNDYPGRIGMIRVGTQAAISTDETGCVPAGLVMEDLLDASVVTTRRFAWPSDIPQDKKSDLYGLSASIDVVKFLQEAKPDP